MKKSIFFIEVDRARTPGRKCHSCGESIPEGTKYLHMKRNKHLFMLCGKCLVIYASKVVSHDPTHKADAMADMI